MTAELISIAVAAPSAPYGSHLARATRFVADAAAHMREIAHAIDASLTELVDGAATRRAVTDAIRAAATRLRPAPPGLFVLSYAGHGGRVADASGDEDDGYDEAWALDDRPLTDDDLTELLAEFDRDVHVVLISNCCFSDGMIDDPAQSAIRPRLPAGALARPARPPMERCATGSSNGIPLAPTGDGDARDADAGITNRIVIASCGVHQMMILPDSSRLTLRVLDAVFPLDGAARRRHPTDYAAVERLVAGLASVTQTPIVRAPDPDMRRQAFVAQPLRPR